MRLTTAVVDAAAVALVAVVAAAGGATAGTLITGDRIKDGTVTSVDVRRDTLTSRDFRDGRLAGTDVADGSVDVRDLTGPARHRLAGAPGRSGLTVAHDLTMVPAGSHDSVEATCPPGKLPISVTGFFAAINDGIQTRIDGDSGTVFGQNLSAQTQRLEVNVLCAFVERDGPPQARQHRSARR